MDSILGQLCLFICVGTVWLALYILNPTKRISKIHFLEGFIFDFFLIFLKCILIINFHKIKYEPGQDMSFRYFVSWFQGFYYNSWTLNNFWSYVWSFNMGKNINSNYYYVDRFAYHLADTPSSMNRFICLSFVSSLWLGFCFLK